jgi:hypothetical protein
MLGFFYGWAERDGEHVRVDVLPPAHLWAGDIMLEEHRPDPKAWTIFLNGEEFARLERREDLPAVLGIEGPPRRGVFARVRALLRQFGGAECTVVAARKAAKRRYAAERGEPVPSHLLEDLRPAVRGLRMAEGRPRFMERQKLQVRPHGAADDAGCQQE